MMKVHIHRDWTLDGMNPDGSGVRRRVTAAQWAMLAGGLVLLLPLAILAIAALLVAMVVFVLVMMVLRIVAAIRGILPGPRPSQDLSRPDAAGRVNVRVLDGRDQGI